MNKFLLAGGGGKCPEMDYPHTLSHCKCGPPWPYRRCSLTSKSVGDGGSNAVESEAMSRKHIMNDLISVMRAADAAARWHVDQRRKGVAQEPYLNHLLEVASLVTDATNGTDSNATIAALLHDVVEDTKVTAKTISDEFGTHVAEIVLEVSDDKSLPKDERKRLQVENAPKKSREAKLIKLADKTSNLRAVANSPATNWSAERRLEYVVWSKRVVAGLRGTSPWLEGQFDDAADQAVQAISR
jgi:HD domain